MTSDHDTTPADARAWLRERGYMQLMTDPSGRTWINGASVMTIDEACAQLDADREDA